MANCNECVKINPLPECIESEAYNPFYMEGLVFADADTDMIAKVRNTGTTKVIYIPFSTDGDRLPLLDITEIFPLMNHVYTIDFVNKETGNPGAFTITNVDGTTSEGCCIEFTVNIGQTDNNGYFVVSTQDCPV